MKCPKCGSDMVVRTARYGPSAGKKFWGCSIYPNCKGTIDINNDDSKLEKNNTYKKISEASKINFTRLYAEPITPEHEVYFFNSLSVSKNVLVDLSYGDKGLHNLRKYGKFRVDISGNKKKPKRENISVYALVLRLLNRGRVTCGSKNTEEELKKILDISNISANDIEELDNFINYKAVKNPVDSDNEQYFIEKWLKHFLGSNWPSHLMTQVQLESLLGSSSYDVPSQRVDFLLSTSKSNLIIELDGKEHEAHYSKDKTRDELLLKAGYEVFRISNDDIDKIDLKLQNKINKLFTPTKKTLGFSRLSEYHIAIKIIHQLQIAIVKALEQGYLEVTDYITVNLETDAFSSEIYKKIVSLAIGELSILINAYFTLYGVNSKFDIKVTYDNNSNNNQVKSISFGNYIDKDNQIIIKDIHFRDDIICDISVFDNLDITRIDRSAIENIMYYLFGYDEFLEGQYEAIERILIKKDSIVLLPTGSGKSLIYQLTAFIVPGQTFVVCPIISLMDDQTDNLSIQGIDNVIAIYSSYDKEDKKSRIAMIKNSNISLVYLSPERLQTKDFRNEINALLVDNSVHTVAIDEAHCVSEWGHDFRTAYLNIGKNARTLFNKNEINPVVVALTGTASSAVLKDVQREVRIQEYDAIITPNTFDRQELNFGIYQTQSDSKMTLITQLMKKYLPDRFGVTSAKFLHGDSQDPYCGIVFCPHTNGDFGVSKVSEELTQLLNVKVGMYSGAPPKTFNNNRQWTELKKNVSMDYKRNKIKILAATKAFGMGIDKSNVRYTIHYGVPGSIESFYQEAGRAGRDRQSAECLIIFSNDYDMKNQQLLDASTSLEELQNHIKTISYEEHDDVSRMLYFHVSSFQGIDIELEAIKYVLDAIYENSSRLKNYHCNVSTNKTIDRNKLEKAIQRLVVLGVVLDYSVSYASQEYHLVVNEINRDDLIDNYSSYVKGYNEGRVRQEKDKALLIEDSNDRLFIIKLALVLVQFIYDTIERGRRRALREIVQLSKAAAGSKDMDSEIRTRVIRYFESTYSLEIEEILSHKDLGFTKIIDLFEGLVTENDERIGGVRSTTDSSKIRGQVSRYLESTADHPGLLFIRAISELYSKDYDEQTIIEDYRAAINFALEKYSVDRQKLLNFLLYMLKKVFIRTHDLYIELLFVTEKLIGEEIFEYLIDSESVENEMRDIPLLMYLNKNIERVHNQIKEGD